MRPGLLFHIQHLYVEAELRNPHSHTLTTGQLSHSTPYPELKCGDEKVVGEGACMSSVACSKWDCRNGVLVQISLFGVFGDLSSSLCVFSL